MSEVSEVGYLTEVFVLRLLVSEVLEVLEVGNFSEMCDLKLLLSEVFWSFLQFQNVNFLAEGSETNLLASQISEVSEKFQNA